MILDHRSSINTGLALLLSCVFCIIQAHPSPASDFRVPPYLQNPTSDGMTLIWFSNSDTPGQLEVRGPGAYQAGKPFESAPYHAVELSYPSWESNRFFGRQNVALSYARSPQPPVFIPPLHRIAPLVYQVNEHHLYPICTGSTLSSSRSHRGPFTFHNISVYHTPEYVPVFIKFHHGTNG